MSVVTLQMEDLPHYTYDDYAQWEGRWELIHKDKIIKYQLYEQAGVKYYCIWDMKTNGVDVFVLQKEKYRKAEVFRDGKMLFDLGPCQIKFDFRKIFV